MFHPNYTISKTNLTFFLSFEFDQKKSAIAAPIFFCPDVYVCILTLPVFPVFGHKEMMAHLLRRHALHHVTRLQWIDDHSVDFLLASVHLHFALVGEQLPIVFTLTDPLPGEEQLLPADIVDLRPQSMVTGEGTGAECGQRLFAVFLVGGRGGSGEVLTSCAYV